MVPPNPTTMTTTTAPDDICSNLTTTTTSSSSSSSATVHPTTAATNNKNKNDDYYYTRGSVELAVETPVLRARLERRRKGTHSCHHHHHDGGERLLIVLVGLPARGKSYVSRKLLQYLRWRGNQCRIFNVGKYRRSVVAAASSESASQPQHQDAGFFDDSNHEAARIRQEAAQLALAATLNWLDDDGGEDDESGWTSSTTTSDEDGASSTTSSTSVTTSVKNELRRLSYGARRQYHRVAIFDATNSTKERRQWILQECAKRNNNNTNQGQGRTGVLFLESLCDDEELLQENYQVKIASCPDFDGMTAEEALRDLKARIDRYTDRYETIPDHDPSSYIKIFNLGSRLMVNHVYGRLAKVVLPAIMAWNTGSRPIYLVRSGETHAMEEYMVRLRDQRLRKQQGRSLQDWTQQNDELQQQQRQLRRRHKSDRLGSRGFRFRDALCDFIALEGMEFMAAKNQTTHGDMAGLHHPCQMETGTSISGLYYEEQEHRPFETYEQQPKQQQRPDVTPGSTPANSAATDTKACTNAPSCSTEDEDDDRSLPFPCLLMSSTLPRAVETGTWERHPFPIKDVTNLNPIDMGDFTGMDLDSIREQHPVWYHHLERDSYNTRFPGGESYSDLIDRLWPVVIDLEQTLGPAVVISHVSVIQILMSYFRAVPITKCTEVEVPMHTVFKFVPLRGGGWLESRHVLLPDDDAQEPAAATPVAASKPQPVAPEADGKDVIWGDSRSCLPHRLR